MALKVKSKILKLLAEDRKPMQLMEHWGNMANFALHNDKSGGLRFAFFFGLSATCQYGTYYRLLQ